MQIDVVTASFIGTLIGAIAGVGGSVATSIITRRSEERRHVRELVIRTALEEWRESVAFAKFKKEREPGCAISVSPLEAFIIPMRKIAAMIERKDLTPEDARKQVREYLLLADAVADEYGKYNSERKR